MPARSSVPERRFPPAFASLICQDTQKGATQRQFFGDAVLMLKMSDCWRASDVRRRAHTWCARQSDPGLSQGNANMKAMQAILFSRDSRQSLYINLFTQSKDTRELEHAVHCGKS